MKDKRIIFITGAFVSNECWNHWSTFFAERGYTCDAPPWPCKNASVQELKKRWPVDGYLSDLTFSGLVDYYSDLVSHQPEKPIVIGHSLGGLIVQILVNRDEVTAGVAIHPAPPFSVFPYEFSFFRAGWKSLGLLTSMKQTYMMPFKDWQYAFVNGMSFQDQKEAYEKFAIPESKRVARGTLTGAAKVDFKKSHVPLLIVGGGTDHFIPAHLNRRNFGRYKDGNSVTEYKESEGRNHFVLGQPTWHEDADFISKWIKARVL